MKTHLLRTITFSCLLFFSVSSSLRAQWVTIPDPVFSFWLGSYWPTCMNGNQLDTTCAALCSETFANINSTSFTNLEGLQYFDSLQDLRINASNVTYIPPLPKLLKIFYFYNGPLISTLPSLPPTLERLICWGGGVTSLPEFPSTLIHLSCAGNLITELPEFPAGLRYIDCGQNPISILPELPDSVDGLYLYDDSSLYCLPVLHYVETLMVQNTRITCLPNYPSGNSFSNPPLDSLPICDLFNGNGCPIFWNISGTIYNDTVGNCTHSTQDHSFSNLKVQLYNNGELEQQLSIGNDGRYTFDTDFSDYQISVDTIGTPFQVICPDSGYLTPEVTLSDSLHSKMDFAIRCKSGFDIGVQSVNVDHPIFFPIDITPVLIKCGDLADFYGINCPNANGITGTVSVTLEGPISYYGPAIGARQPDNVNGNTITWNVADFGNLNIDSEFNIKVQTNISAQSGEKVCITTTAIAGQNDNNLANNYLKHCFVVINSHDPNEKEVYPLAEIDTSQEWLTYTVRFQNTGTASARNIYITDTLDSDLDVSSFQLLAYSHQPMVQIKENAVRFNFPNINLPDSNTNEPQSHGYVQYKVRLKAHLPIGTVVNNTAFIYFDFNAPVVTNTTTNTIAIVSGIGKSEIANPKFEIYPNPAADVVTISVDETKTGSVVHVSDLAGRKILMSNIEHRMMNIETEQLANGVYFVTVIDRDGASGTRKLVVSR